MAEQDPQQQAQIQFLLSDFNTRLRDLEERNRIIRERVLLLGQNLISSREESEQELQELKKQSNQNKRDAEKSKKLADNIISELDKFAKRDEVLIIERMLKDFQPLEFMRKKDVEELIDKKLKAKTKTKKTNQKNS